MVAGLNVDGWVRRVFDGDAGDEETNEDDEEMIEEIIDESYEEEEITETEFMDDGDLEEIMEEAAELMQGNQDSRSGISKNIKRA